MSTNIQDLPYTPTVQFSTTTPNMELPSRDIPKQTIQHVADEQITPNYVPPLVHDYIGKVHYEPPKPKGDLLEEFRTPIILSILYFVFQLPMMNVFLMRMLPNQVALDGNLTPFGMMVKSAVFGMAYYGVLHILEKLKS